MACNRFVVPAGRIFFDPCPNSGERYLGETPGAEITVDIKSVEVLGSDAPISELIDEIPFGVVRELKFKCIAPSDDIHALFFGADPATVTQTDASVTDEPINGVRRGCHYQLGQSASNPTGVRGVSTVVVTDDDDLAPTTFEVTTDYLVDADLGRIYIVPGGAIADGTNLLIDYGRAANSRTRHAATPDLAARLIGSLRFIANHTSGPNRDIYLPRGVLMADGAVQVKRAQGDGKVQEFSLKFKAQRKIDSEGAELTAALYIDGRAVAA
jgi:hypothetical protein